MTFMIRSHHIAAQLVAEHQRDLRASSRPRWRLSSLFGRKSAELEPVPPAQIASAAGRDGPGPARVPLAGRPAPAWGDQLRARRGSVPAHVAPALSCAARTPEQSAR
jgi:hypothetical protein